MANKVSQREGNARLTIGLLSGMSIVAAAFAIYIGLRQDQPLAILTLVFAIACGVAACLSYRRYTALRNVRWQAELAESNKELDRVLGEQRSAVTPLSQDIPLRLKRKIPLPTARTQRYLAWAAVLGTLFACFGCGLYASNNVRVATLFLVVAWLILVPIFIYLLAVRRRSKRVVRQTLQQQEEQRQRELDALASVTNLLSKDQSSRADDASQSEKTV